MMSYVAMKGSLMKRVLKNYSDKILLFLVFLLDNRNWHSLTWFFNYN